MKILSRDSLPRGGFAGLKETRLIVDRQIGGRKDTWDGVGRFVYLADARYLPHGETKMHSHKEIDIVTILLEGNLHHEGSLKNGQSMTANQVQVQRAGGEGFSHNEINPDTGRTRLLQVWVLPESPGKKADYKLYNLQKNQLTRIYGGKKSQKKTFDSHTVIEVGLLQQNTTIRKKGNFLAYVTNGEAELNGGFVMDGDLIRGKDMTLTVTSPTLHITVFSVE